MTYTSMKELSEPKRIFKSAPVVKTEKDIPGADAEIIADAKAREILDKAKIEADLTMQKAGEESSGLLEKAKMEGFAKGQAEAQTRYNDLLDAIQKVLGEMEGMNREMREDLKETIIALSLEIAVKTIKKEIETDPIVINELASDVLSKISPAHDVVLRLNPTDFDALKDLQTDLESAAGYPEKFKISPDPSLSRGDVVVNYERGTVDAKIKSQLENIANELMGSIG